MQEPIKRVNKKVVISGPIVEVYDYDIGYLQGGQVMSNKGGRKIGDIDEIKGDKDENRQLTMNRAKRDLRRLINANMTSQSKFVTLTFADNETDIKYCNEQYHKFIKRLNYQVMGSKKASIKYSTVIEFQKRGAVHYHTVFYNLPYIPNKRLQQIWNNGFVKVNKIDNVDNVGAYVCKYMNKDLTDERLLGNKCYFSSRNLNKPIEIVEDGAREFADYLSPENLRYSTEFENEYLGKINYKQYNLLETDSQEQQVE